MSMNDKEKTEGEIIEELTTKYDCDGISAIEAEKSNEGWLLKFFTWDGHIFEMQARDMKMRKV